MLFSQSSAAPPRRTNPADNFGRCNCWASVEGETIKRFKKKNISDRRGMLVLKCLKWMDGLMMFRPQLIPDPSLILNPWSMTSILILDSGWWWREGRGGNSWCQSFLWAWTRLGRIHHRWSHREGMWHFITGHVTIRKQSLKDRIRNKKMFSWPFAKERQ